MIAAALLSREPVTITNVPDIADVSAMLDVARGFGTKVSRNAAAGTVTLTSHSLKAAKIAPELAAKLRTSILFAGPLLARLGRASLPPPGGDAIGHRRLDTHFAGFKALGAKAKAGKKTLVFKGALRGAEMLLDEASVTATENILMASVLAKGRTVIYNAACEPHIVDLATMLNSMGAKISGAGTNRLEIEGVETLHGCEARVGCDYIEAGSYLVAAAATGGELVLAEIDPEHVREVRSLLDDRSRGKDASLRAAPQAQDEVRPRRRHSVRLRRTLARVSVRPDGRINRPCDSD